MSVYLGMGGPGSLPPFGGPPIGTAISGGTAYALLFLDPSSQLANSVHLKYDDSANILTLDASIVRTRVADGTIVANTFVKMSTSTAGRRVQWTTSDDPFLICGIALSAGTSGASFMVLELRGQTVQVKTDGVAAISKGTPVFISDSSNGRISGTDNQLYAGIAEADDAGGTADALVSIHW